MIHGSTILRFGLAIVFFAAAFVQATDPETPNFLPGAVQYVHGPTAWYIAASIDVLLGILLLFGFLPRVAPVLAGVYLLLTPIAIGWLDPNAIRDTGLAICSFSLVFIHEEHIPTRTKNILATLFRKH